MDPIFRINPGRRFPIPWASPLLWLVLGSTALLAYSAWVSHRRSKDTSLLACAWFSAALLPYALQRADDFHLASAGCVSVALMPAALTVLLDDERRRLAVPIACLIVVASSWESALRGTMESVGQAIGVGDPPSYPLTFNGRTVPVPLKSQVDQLSGLLSAVEGSTEPGDGSSGDRAICPTRSTTTRSSTTWSGTHPGYLLPRDEPRNRRSSRIFGSRAMCRLPTSSWSPRGTTTWAAPHRRTRTQWKGASI